MVNGFKEMGDGLILIFDTVTDAVNGCIKIQEAARNVEHLNLRIGMHEGEILLMENDVIGMMLILHHELKHSQHLRNRHIK